LDEVYIDENCRLCNSFGTWINNKSDTIKISNQKNLNQNLQNLDTLIFSNETKTYKYSDAVIMSVYSIGGIYKLILLLKILPKPFRDKVYKFVAKHRNGQKFNHFFKKKNLKTFIKTVIVFSIFRAIYGALILFFAYRITVQTENNIFLASLFFIFSMFLSRQIFKKIKNRLNL
jgi:predicted DCC family thiol-disulfide oxidoreductase YuxK